MTDKKIDELVPVTALAAADLLAVVQGGDTEKATVQQIIDKLGLGIGWFNYDDTETTSTPISLSSGVWTNLTNDASGPQNNETNGPAGVTTLWNDSTDRFDFTELNPGDLVFIRLDAEVTTGGVNQEVGVRWNLGMGAGNFQIPFAPSTFYKDAGAHEVGGMSFIFMLDANIIDNPGTLQVRASGSGGSVIVNGWVQAVIKLGA